MKTNLFSNSLYSPRNTSFHIVYIVWAYPKTRAKELSKRLNAKLYNMTISQRVFVLIRYVILFFKTLKILFADRPKYIIVQLPPIFALFGIYLYCLFSGARYIVDVHSGEILDNKWKPYRIIRKYFFKRAYWILFHNDHNHAIAKKLYGNIRGITLNDPIPLPSGDLKIRNCEKCKNVVIISTYDINEPFLECVKAGQLLSKENDGWVLTFTGDSSVVPQKYKNLNNIEFTGFVTYNEYWAILRGADVIVSLNKRRGVITCGLWEGVSLNKPVVTNDYPVIKSIFGDSLIYSKNDYKDILRAIKVAYQERKKYRRKIMSRKNIIELEWGEKFLTIKNSL